MDSTARTRPRSSVIGSLALTLFFGTLLAGCGTAGGAGSTKTGGAAGARAAREAGSWLERGFALTGLPFTLMAKPVAEGRLSSPFGKRRNPTRFKLLRKMHKGVDYAAPAGTPVYAAGDGTVDKLYVSTSYGNYVRIAHADGFQTVYAHLSAFAEGLVVGSTVNRGEQIGAVGSTGSSTADHLHYELLHAGRHVDPLFARTP